MNRPLGALFVLTRASAFAGFLVGGVWALWQIAGERHVREFQAGPDSPWTERLYAIAQRAAIEGLGFGAVGLLLGLVAVLYAALGRRSAASHAQRATAGFLLGAAAFAVLTTSGAWFLGEALPFLPIERLLAVDALAFAALLVGLLAAHAIVRRLPFAARGAPVATAAASVVALAVAASVAVGSLRAAEDWRSPAALAIAGAIGLAAPLPVAAVLSRALEPLAGALGRALERRPPLAPRRAWALAVALGLCAAVTLPTFSLRSPAAPAQYTQLPARGERRGPNVLFVTIDTLRADHLGCYGYARPTSPFLDELAARGTLFADAASAAAWTKPATGTILTGLYPSRHGALYHGSSLRVPDEGLTLAESFQRSGYVTAGFVSNPNVKAVFDFDRGFDEFFDSPVEDTVDLASIRGSVFGHVLTALTRYQFNWKYENDVQSINRQVLGWLEANRDAPFFVYAHYIDPHEPYAPPPEYEERFRQEHEGFPLFNERKRLVGKDLYDGEIRYTDDHLAQLVAQMKELGVWDDTIVVVTSDHGEEFFEHEVMGHGFSLYQDVIHVPLIVHGPGVAAGRVVEEPVQIVDLAATVLDLAGTGLTALGDGTSFAESARAADWDVARTLFLENEFGTEHNDHRSFVLSAVREGRFKLVQTTTNKYRPLSAGYPPFELYDLVADPGETNNLFSDPSYFDVAQRLAQRLMSHATFLEEHGQRLDGAAPVIDPDVERELKAMGYL